MTTTVWTHLEKLFTSTSGHRREHVNIRLHTCKLSPVLTSLVWEEVARRFWPLEERTSLIPRNGKTCFDSPNDEWRWLRNYLMQPVKSENDWEVSQQVKREDLWVGQVEVTKVSAIIAKYVCIVFCFYSPFHPCILVLLVRVHPPDPPSTWIHWRSVAPANTVQNTCCSPVSD